jgi:hypothetical protein
MMPASRRTIFVRARQLREQRSRLVLSVTHLVERRLLWNSFRLQNVFVVFIAQFDAARLRSEI